MAKRINVDKFVSAVLEELDEYAVLTQDALAEAIEETAEETAKAVSDKAAVRTGKYKESITYGKVGKHGSTAVYAEAPEYRLTHLLEKGHASRNGGRVQPSPQGGHWQAPSEAVPDKLVSKLKGKMLK